MTERLTRNDDYDTSYAAAAMQRGKLSDKQTIVYEVHLKHPKGLTDEDLNAAIVLAGYPRSAESTWRKRRTDLAAKGLLVDTGERRKSKHGINMIVWGIKKDEPH